MIGRNGANFTKNRTAEHANFASLYLKLCPNHLFRLETWTDYSKPPSIEKKTDDVFDAATGGHAPRERLGQELVELEGVEVAAPNVDAHVHDDGGVVERQGPLGRRGPRARLVAVVERIWHQDEHEVADARAWFEEAVPSRKLKARAEEALLPLDARRGSILSDALPLAGLSTPVEA